MLVLYDRWTYNISYTNKQQENEMSEVKKNNNLYQIKQSESFSGKFGYIVYKENQIVYETSKLDNALKKLAELIKYDY